MKYQDISSMKVEQRDIEHIFGKPQKTLLFSKDEYQPLLQQILSAPYSTYDKTKLPFGNTPNFHVDDGLFFRILAYSKASV